MKLLLVVGGRISGFVVGLVVGMLDSLLHGPVLGFI